MFIKKVFALSAAGLLLTGCASQPDHTEGKRAAEPPPATASPGVEAKPEASTDSGSTAEAEKLTKPGTPKKK